jgi:hypothetical protein
MRGGQYASQSKRLQHIIASMTVEAEARKKSNLADETQQQL